jgi:hypothetical protein
LEKSGKILEKKVNVQKKVTSPIVTAFLQPWSASQCTWFL